MRLFALVRTVVCSLLLAAAGPARSAFESYPEPDAVAVEPRLASPGQPVTLRWYFTGDKVVVSGGRFGKGLIVTGKSVLTDTPKQTTTYHFDVWYRVPAAGPDGQLIQKPVQVRYTATARVGRPDPFSLKTYRDSRGWQVSHLPGWQVDREPLPDPANNALVFFQQEDDSVERLAVSILPAADLTADALVDRVERSLSGNYEDVKLGTRAPHRVAGCPAVLWEFTGNDNSHPGTRTQSLLMAFVKDGRGYVVTARSSASRFDQRRPALEAMVKSFTVVEKTAKK